MRSRLCFAVLAAAVVAAPAFAATDSPTGQWDGVLERNGARAPVTVQLAERGGLWRGRIEIDGASSPADSVRVAGNNVHFELPSQGAFDGTISGDSMTGEVSGASGRPGSFKLTREPPTDLFPYSNPLEMIGP
jgi:hypothetical protein